MKLTPVSSPHAIQPTSVSSNSKRSAAIEAFNKGQSSYDKPAPTTGNAQEMPVANPNRISPEELSAVKPQTPETPDNLATSEDTPPAVEKAETTQEKNERDPALSRQFAQLARQERQLRAKVQQEMKAIEAQKAELAVQQAAIKTKEQEYGQGYISKDQLKQDTLRILADSGVSYDDLTQQILNAPGVNPQLDSAINSLKAEIKDLKSQLDQGKQQQIEQQQQAYKAAVKQIETDVRQLITMDPQFETIKATRSTSDVVELIEETYKKDGVLMSVEEACQEVENYLTEEALKLTRIGKIKRQLEQAGQPKPTQQQTQAPKQQTPAPMKTLTNAAASTRKLTAKERAVLAFRGELKS